MKNAGSVTYAQNEESSVVYGMPKAAVALGAVTEVLDPNALFEELFDIAGR